MIPVTPATFAGLLNAARPGDQFQLGEGVYPALSLKGLSGVSVRGVAGASLGGLALSGCSDVALSGLRFKGPGNVYGLNVSKGSNITLEDSVFDGFNHQLLVGLTNNFRGSRIEFLHFTSDAADFGNAWGFTLEDFIIHSPSVDLATGVHPDGVQIWSRPFDPNTREPWKPTCDGLIQRGTIIGAPMQGICQTNHVRDWPATKAGPALKQVDDGGADRITIIDNRIWGGGRACSASAVRDLTFQRNHVSTLPQAASQALYTYQGSTDVKSGGNVMDAAPWLGKKGAGD